MAASTAASESPKPLRPPLRAAELRPRRVFAGSTSYFRCAIAPDERLVAYAVQPCRYEVAEPARWTDSFLPSGVPRKLEGAELCLAALEAGERGTTPAPRVLTPSSAGWGTSFGPCWSPDGRLLAFYSDRNGTLQVWLWDRDTGGVRLAHEAPAALRFGLEGLRWLPDGRRLVAKLRAPGWDATAFAAEGAAGPAKGTRDVWVSPLDEGSLQRREEGIRWFDLSRGDIAVIDVQTGDARRIGTEVVPRGIAVSPDGRYVAALCERGEEGERHHLNVSLFDLRLFSTDGAEQRVLAGRVPQAFGVDFAWSPGSDALAFIALDGRPGAPGRLVVAATHGREPASFGGDAVSFGDEQGFAPPLWSADGRTLYAFGDRPGGGGTVFAVDPAGGGLRDLGAGLEHAVTEVIWRAGVGTAPDLGHPGTVAVVALDPRTRHAGLFRVGGGAPVRLAPEDSQALRGISYKGDCGARWIVGPAADGAHPLIDLYAFRADGPGPGERRRLTALNAHLETVPRLESFLIPMRGLGGEARQAAVWLPLDYETGRRYPTIVELYLGSRAGASRFDPQRLPLAWRGYLVVKPDTPHVPGVDPAEAATRYALNALEAAAEQGYADPRRAGLFGHSAGGYDVCCVVTRTDTFRAAVASAPFTDLVTFALRPDGNRLGNTGQVEGGHVRMAGTLWDERERYLANSPVFHADRITTPLLLLCGTADQLLPQAEELYGGLLRLGKTATLVRYHGEGHVAYGAWSDANFEDYWARIIDWFDRHLPGAEH